jgi:uncharacterized protein YyaL (SSP411 family)
MEIVAMPNRLARETSPYLQQHAGNPVDWYPWGEEALKLARDLDKPILLSIGYSACHWCHVMAHESFEDDEVAAVMNRLYVNIKVDREERPDLDQIYQSAHGLLTRRNGGWPLTMFLSPDGTPFAAGTYFPKVARYGMPAFADVLKRIESAYRFEREAIERQNAATRDALAARTPSPSEAASLDAQPLATAVAAFTRMYDAMHGGLGRAPKFPHPYELDFLLTRQARGVPECMQMVVHTLTGMANGGIFDHLGGGFCRYSTDDKWSIPHFEKMLYDNAALLALYADAHAATGIAMFAEVVEESAAWVMREMQSPAGGYYSSLDADSEGEEGRYYVWTPEQVRALLSEEAFAVAAARYGLDDAPNFEGRHWHLRVRASIPEIARRTGAEEQRCLELLQDARSTLFAARERRVRPARDDKLLTSWNALMIRGMARAGRRLRRTDWIQSARRAAAFVRSTLWTDDGRLLATHKDGRSHLNAYLDDYAFLLDALIELLQADFHAGDVAFARTIADALLARFEDTAEGGFYFTSHDHERLIHRPKPGIDTATPAGNGVAAVALQRLGLLLGEPRYLDAAARTLELFWPLLERHAEAFPTLLQALAEHLDPPRIVILRGPDAQVSSWHDALNTRYRADALALAIPNGTSGLPDVLAHPEADGVNAWVCEGVECLPPVNDLAALTRMLDRHAAGTMGRLRNEFPDKEQQ